MFGIHIAVIYATDPNGVIGVKDKNGKLTQPFFSKRDLTWFKNTTQNQAVIMGRITFEAIGKPLPNRLNIVITGNEQLYGSSEEISYVGSIMEALAKVKIAGLDTAYFIGGAQVIEQVFAFADSVYLTKFNQYVEVNGYSNQDDYVYCLPFKRNDLILHNSLFFVDKDSKTGETLIGEFQHYRSIYYSFS